MGIATKVNRSLVDNPEKLEQYLRAVADDLGKLKTAMDSSDTGAIAEIITDHATNIAAIAANKTATNLLLSRLQSSVMQNGTLAISATAEKFKTTTTTYALVNGIGVTKAATDNLVFSAGDTINTAPGTGDFHGAWLVEMDIAGNIATKPAGGLSDQVYTSKALAVAALPAATTDKVAIGYITVQASTDSAWTANTDDMTPASDCAANTYVDTTEVPLSGDSAISLSPAATLTATGVTDTGTLEATEA